MGRMLIVDDSIESRTLLKRILVRSGYEDVIEASSGEAAIELLYAQDNTNQSIDLILLDVVMPGMNGIDVCKKIKEDDRFIDLPIIMVTGMDDVSILEQAFKAGAMDYIKKPYYTLELHARIGNALKLKQEMDKRKARERELLDVTEELQELNYILEQLSNIDSLTDVANRRSFDLAIQTEWRKALRTGEPLSLLIFDIDKFKVYNDTYGHQVGDQCLKEVAAVLKETINSARFLVARYGGEEFVAILPNTSLDKAIIIAEKTRENILKKKIVHEKSTVSKYLTISVGVSCAYLNGEATSVDELIRIADEGLYLSKRSGLNQVRAIQRRDINAFI